MFLPNELSMPVRSVHLLRFVRRRVEGHTSVEAAVVRLSVYFQSGAAPTRWHSERRFGRVAEVKRCGFATVTSPIPSAPDHPGSRDSGFVTGRRLRRQAAAIHARSRPANPRLLHAPQLLGSVRRSTQTLLHE